MKPIKLFVVFCLVCFLSSCSVDSSKVLSPDENIEVKFHLKEVGRFFYTINYKEKAIIDTSFVGFEFTNAPELTKGFIAKVKKPTEVDETWQMTKKLDFKELVDLAK